MTASMRASLTAIGRELQVDYSSSLAEPLPSELEKLVAQLVALETRKRGSTARSANVFQAATAHLAPST